MADAYVKEKKKINLVCVFHWELSMYTREIHSLLTADSMLPIQFL